MLKELLEKKEKIAVIGMGYVGLPLAVAFAEKNIDVIGFDINKEKIEKFLDRLNSVNSNRMLGLETKYLLISLPVIDKEKFVDFAIRMAVNKAREYECK